MQVAKWGNSLAIRLPRSVVNVLGLKEGDSVEIHVADRRSFAIEKAPTSKTIARAATQVPRSATRRFQVRSPRSQ